MSRATERLAAQEQIEADRLTRERPNHPPTALADDDPNRCPIGRAHDFTMHGTDRKVRCWLCCRFPKETQAQFLARMYGKPVLAVERPIEAARR